MQRATTRQQNSGFVQQGQAIGPSPNFSFSNLNDGGAASGPGAMQAMGAMPLPPVRNIPARAAAKDEPGVFAGFIGDGVDRNKEFPQGRYTISNKLGSGTYGKVLGCVDKKYNLPVAIKIVRKDPPIYKEAAKKEIAVLRHLAGTHGCLRLLRDFEHDGHLCISMEMYGENLQAYMKRKGQPFNTPAVCNIGLQLMHACEYMHSKQIIHTDLKSENILLAAGPDGSYTIKLVDMGSSLFMSWWHPPIIGTMEYRAPETLLQAGWSAPVDNFAAGCVIAELTSGVYLLPGLREEEHLKAIESVLEMRIPQNVLQMGKKNMNQYNQKLIVRRGNELAIPDVALQHPVRKLRTVLKHDKDIYSLCAALLAIDPALRLTATEAKGHVFFKQSTFDASNVDEAFCLKPREENPNDVSLVPAISMGDFSNYNMVDGEVDDDDDDDIVETQVTNGMPPPRPPPPAPKPLTRLESPARHSKPPPESPGASAHHSEDAALFPAGILKKESSKATRAAAPPPRPALHSAAPPDAQAASDVHGLPPNTKPPKAPGVKEAVHSIQPAAGGTPAKPNGAPQLLQKAGSTDLPRKSALHKYISPMLGPEVFQSEESPTPMKASEGASQLKARQAAREGGRAEQENPQTPAHVTHNRVHAVRSAAPPPPDNTPIRHAAAQRNATRVPTTESTPPEQLSPGGSRPAGFISGILTNLTSAVKTTIASPTTGPVGMINMPSPPSMQDNEKENDDKRHLNSATPATAPSFHVAKLPSSAQSEGGGGEGGSEETLNWECDLSDRLARLHERLTRLRHENSVWAEGSRSRRSSGKGRFSGEGGSPNNSLLTSPGTEALPK